MNRSFATKLLYTLVLISLIGCGSGSTNVGRQTGSVTAQLNWIERTGSSVLSSGKQTAAAPQGVVTVRIVVSGSDMSNVQQDFPASAGTGVIGGVPVGSNRTLTAQGLDASGVVTHQGVKHNITVQADQTTDTGIVVMYPAGQTFTVSGRVTLNNSGLAGVAVSLQGTSFTTVTGSDGTYSISGVPNASYTVVPSLAGYTFAPANRSIPDSNGDVTGQDFTATPIPVQTHNISGRVTLNGSGLSGVTVSLQGTSFTTVTGSDGTYSLTGVSNGSYTIIPSLAGYTFTPASRSVNVNNSDVAGQDFAATAQSHTISGRVTLNGGGLSGVTVSLQGTSSNSATTNSDGNYAFTGVQNGLYTVTPSLTGYAFTPANRSVSVNNGDVTGQDFIATTSQPAAQGTVSGTVTDTLGNPLSGVTVRLLSGSSVIATITNNGDGTYSLTGPAGSGYTVEFSKTGYITSNASNITITANTTTGNVNMSLSPTLLEGQTRIVLTWGETPSDLDSHLTGPIPNSSQRFHIYYGEPCYPQDSCTFDNDGNTVPGANTDAVLDHDDTSSFGPETTTVVRQYSGAYKFFVHDFPGNDPTSTALSNSGAQVKVYQGNTLVATFNVPTNQAGTVWTVFELNGSTIAPINTISPDETVIQSASLRTSLKEANKKGTKR